MSAVGQVTGPGSSVLVVALACAGGAAALLLPPPADLARARQQCAHDRLTRPGRAGGRGGGRRVGVAVATTALALVGGALGVVLGLPVRRLVLALVLAATVAIGLRLHGGRRRRQAAARTRHRVAEVCEEVAAELGAGRSAAEALTRAAREWPPLAPVAEADRLGADVPDALRALARQPGAEDLVVVAAAWHVAHRTGQGLSDALARVAIDLRDQRALRRIVDGELSSARATARLVAALPLLALLMGSGAGGDPWGFLLDSAAGLACLAGGLLLGSLGLAWIEAIAASVDRGVR